MNNIAIIENDVIVNVIVADEEWAKDAFPDYEIIVCPSGVGVGWTREGEDWNPPLSPETHPVNVSRITRRQGLIALYTEQGIQEQDVQAVINAIEDPSQRYIAQVEFANQYWEIDNPLIASFGEALQVSPERLQELFNIAATL